MNRLPALAMITLLLAGCEALQEPVTRSVLTQGPRDITVYPPLCITFDDIEPVASGFRPLFGSTDSIHFGKGSCCAYGPCHGARSPAIVDLKSTFDAIEEYRTLQKSGLDPDSPQYIVTLARVNERFAGALGQYLQESRLYDTVFARGTIRLRSTSKAAGLPDVTWEVLKRLR